MVAPTVLLHSQPAPADTAGARNKKSGWKWRPPQPHVYRRLWWVAFVYLPLALPITAALLAACTALHVVSHPGLLLDTIVDAAVSFVRGYIFSAASCLVATVYNRFFGEPARPIVVKQRVEIASS